MVRRAPRGGATAAADPAVEIPSSAGGGLPAELRTGLAAALGSGLDGVRVHSGPESAAAAERLDARAFTVGQDIHFGAGEYAPGSAAGDHLIAHEVAHTVQAGRDGSADVHASARVAAPGDACEVEAETFADAFMAGGTAAVTGATGAVHRAPRSSGYVLEVPTVRIAGSKATQAGPADPGAAGIDIEPEPVDVIDAAFETANTIYQGAAGLAVTRGPHLELEADFLGKDRALNEGDVADPAMAITAELARLLKKGRVPGHITSYWVPRFRSSLRFPESQQKSGAAFTAYYDQLPKDSTSVVLSDNARADSLAHELGHALGVDPLDEAGKAVSHAVEDGDGGLIDAASDNLMARGDQRVTPETAQKGEAIDQLNRPQLSRLLASPFVKKRP